MATLKQLVDETTNIKNDIVDCYNNLKDTLATKGVEVSNINNLHSLVESANNILAYRLTDSMNFERITTSERYSTKTHNETTFTVLNNNIASLPMCLLKFEIKGNSADGYVYATVYHKRGDQVILSKKFESPYTGNIGTCSLELSNFNLGDYIEVYLKSGYIGTGLYVEKFRIYCGVELID